MIESFVGERVRAIAYDSEDPIDVDVDWTSADADPTEEAIPLDRAVASVGQSPI